MQILFYETKNEFDFTIIFLSDSSQEDNGSVHQFSHLLLRLNINRSGARVNTLQLLAFRETRHHPIFMRSLLLLKS